MKGYRAVFTREGLANLALFTAGLATIAILAVSVVTIVLARWFGVVFIAACVAFVLLDRSGVESGASESESESVHSSSGAPLSLSDREHGRRHAVGEPKVGSGLPPVAPTSARASGSQSGRGGSPAASSQRAVTLKSGSRTGDFRRGMRCTYPVGRGDCCGSTPATPVLVDADKIDTWGGAALCREHYLLAVVLS